MMHDNEFDMLTWCSKENLSTQEQSCSFDILTGERQICMLYELSSIICFVV